MDQMPTKTNFTNQQWRKLHKGGGDNNFNPLLNTIKQALDRQFIFFVHTGKCAGESIIKGMNKVFGKDVIIYNYHVFDANERLLEALDFFHRNKSENLSVVIATRDPLDRWVSSYNWDLHNLFLRKRKSLPNSFSAFSNVNLLAHGIKNNDVNALNFGRFGHMGMGVSWYLPIATHSLLDHRNTYVIRTENLDADFHGFAIQLCKSLNLREDLMSNGNFMLPRTKHDFQSSYPRNTFQGFNHDDAELVYSMQKFLENDYMAHASLVKTFC